MRLLRKLISNIIYAVCLAFALFTAFLLFGKYKVYVVETGSREPDYPVGSVLFVKECEPETLSENDVITFQKNGATVTHRIVKVNKDERTFVTKGDANASEDIRPVSFDSLIGIVRLCVPNMGTAVMYLSSAYGKVGIVALALIGVLIDPGKKEGKKNEDKV